MLRALGRESIESLKGKLHGEIKQGVMNPNGISHTVKQVSELKFQQMSVNSNRELEAAQSALKHKAIETQHI